MNINKAFQSARDLYLAGNLKQAEYVYREILKNEPNNVSAYYELGNVLQDGGRLDEAVDCFKKAIKIDPKIIEVHYNLGSIFHEKGQLSEALKYYRKALRLNPHSAEIYNTIGAIFKHRKQFDDAMAHFEKALKIDPHFSMAYYNLGNIYEELLQIEQAIRHYRNAIQYNPYYSKVYYRLGHLLMQQYQFDDAITCYKNALEIYPQDAHLHYELGNVYREKGQFRDSVSHYQKAVQINPRFIEAHWAKCFSQIPMNYPDYASIESCRARYYEELIKLQDIIMLDNKENIEAANRAVGSQQPFYLAYQGFNNRELQQMYGSLVCKIMAQRYPQFAIRPKMPSYSSEGPLRIGFVSGHFRLHAVWKIPIKGWIENIDKQRFNLYGYYAGGKKDYETATARKYFYRFIEDVHSFEDLCKIIRNDDLHIIIYPEIGMEPLSLRLASLRLAPIQCVSWGHPVTSGLPTIDYFLSSELIESSEADKHYTEKLIRLPNLSIYYKPFEIPYLGLNRSFFGIRSKVIVYHCCQSPYKFLPQYDAVFPRIAKNIGNCQFLFSSDPLSNAVTEQFRSRIRLAFEKFNFDYDEYVTFLPFLDIDQYYALYRLADIFMDPIGWSGCNSTFEAIACNLPVVTFPSMLMRGRESAAILKMMGVEDTIAKDIDNYVEIAVKLGRDLEWRNLISEKIVNRRHLVYRDKTCIIGLEKFFEDIVKERLKES